MRLLTTQALRVIRSGKFIFLNRKISFVSLTTIQFGSSIRIAPVPVSAMGVEATAAILIVTVKALVKMVAAEMLVANRT